MTQFCPNFVGVARATTPEKNYLITTARCKCWSCEFCAEKNRAQWTAAILDHINKSGLDWSWFTLTAHPQAHKWGWEYTRKNILGTWDRLIKRMKRKYGKFEYVRVLELHASGAFHLHAIRSGTFDDIVTRRKGSDSEFTDSPWLRKNAVNVGLGYMTHAGNIEGEKRGAVAFYVVKYMAKLDTEGLEKFRGCRRIQTSRGIKRVTVKNDDLVWDMLDSFREEDMAQALVQNRTVKILDTGEQMTFDNFEEHDRWPIIGTDE